MITFIGIRQAFGWATLRVLPVLVVIDVVIAHHV